MKEYQTKFEQLLAKAGYLPPVRQVSCFVNRLKESIKANVLAGRLEDLSSAIGLARLFEARNSSLQRNTPSTQLTTKNFQPWQGKKLNQNHRFYYDE